MARPDGVSYCTTNHVQHQAREQEHRRREQIYFRRGPLQGAKEVARPLEGQAVSDRGLVSGAAAWVAATILPFMHESNSARKLWSVQTTFVAYCAVPRLSGVDKRTNQLLPPPRCRRVPRGFFDTLMYGMRQPHHKYRKKIPPPTHFQDMKKRV